MNYFLLSYIGWAVSSFLSYLTHKIEKVNFFDNTSEAHLGQKIDATVMCHTMH